jgi:Protein of unknown function (DUF2569)
VEELSIMPEDLDLAARYSRWATEDLARSVTTEASELTPEALTAMRRELERRGYVAGAEQPMAAGGHASAAEAPRGVGGFLRLLLFLVGLMSITALWVGVDALDARGGTASRLTAAGWACVGAYGVVCWVLLMRLDRRAPSLAALWFAAVAALVLIDSLRHGLVTGTVTPDLFTIFHSGLWMAYLSRSKRVKATFGGTAGW